MGEDDGLWASLLLKTDWKRALLINRPRVLTIGMVCRINIKRGLSVTADLQDTLVEAAMDLLGRDGVERVAKLYKSGHYGREPGNWRHILKANRGRTKETVNNRFRTIFA